MKKIPYGISNYEELVTEEYYYVDKTMYLSMLENVRKPLLYLRPRTFGKSLFTSMMFYYYDILSKDKFDTLFKDTYVYNNPTPNKNNYYVLNLDFSGMSSYNNELKELEYRFYNLIIEYITNFINYYKLNIKLKHFNNATDLLEYFLIKYNSLRLDKKLFIIIDEYDNFINSMLFNNKDMFVKILGDNSFVKDFYAKIKTYYGSIIDQVFVTGICFYKLGDFTNITLDYRFNNMTGFTLDEINKLINYYNIRNKEEVINDILKYYNGYIFSHNISNKIFNTTITMYYLSSIISLREKPSNLLDLNVRLTERKLRNILSLGDYKEILDDIFDNGEITGELRTNFNLTETFDRDDVISLLFYFGYLTINTNIIESVYTFNVPNRVIKSIYSDYYLSILKEYNIKTTDTLESDAILEISKEGKINKLCEYVSKLLSEADNRLYLNFKEKDLQIIMYTILTRYNYMDAKIEYHLSNDYIDLMIFKTKYCNFNILIELKYIKVKDKDTYNDIKSNAIEQIKRYSSSVDKETRKYVVIFTGSEYTIDEIN